MYHSHLRTVKFIKRKENENENELQMVVEECPICYEKIISNKLVKMSCEHSFCLQCIQGCITSIQTTEQIFVCPMCRQQSNSITLSNPTIYNTIANTLYKL